MKRSPLKRSAPMARTGGGLKRTRLRPRRAEPRRSSRVRDEAYLAWCRLQPCAVGRMIADDWWKDPDDHFVRTVAPFLGCLGPTDPEHRREGVGMGQKASDRDAWPCCRGHHDQRHNTASGLFRGWGRAKLDAFIRERIAEANARYDAERAGGAAAGREIIPF